MGCKQDPLRYCPNNPVSRAQMATLLRRGLRNEGTETGSISIDVRPRSNDTLITATRGRTCALRLDSTVTCWGGDEGHLEHLSASGLDDVVALSTGNHPTLQLHTCVVHTNGAVSCWGSGHEGQLGRGDTTHHLPEVVPGITDAVAVAAGPSFTCVVHDGGAVSCWGLNQAGQLSDDSPVSNRDWPRRVPGLEGGSSDFGRRGSELRHSRRWRLVVLGSGVRPHTVDGRRAGGGELRVHWQDSNMRCR